MKNFPPRNMIPTCNQYVTKIIQITDLDYGPNLDYGSIIQFQITDSDIRIQVTDPGYESRLWTWITDSNIESGLLIQITDPDYRFE